MGAAFSPPADPLPLGRVAQRDLERAWSDVVRAPDGLDVRHAVSRGVRRAIASSWRRSHEAEVSPTLHAAPRALDDDALRLLQERTDWLAPLRTVLAAQRDGYVGADQMLAVFDATGRMLMADGDPLTLDALADINFRPGALWSEDAAGTNGPGTALITQRPVHVVGAEHFCERWRAWHCASVPVRHPTTGSLLGVIDLSGARDSAHPYALTMATAIAVALEQRLATRDAERRATLLLAWARQSAHYPADGFVAVDAYGHVIADADDGGREQRRLQALGDEGRALLAELIRGDGSGVNPGATREVSHPLLGSGRAVLQPVEVEGRVVGACVLLPRRATPRRATVEQRPASRVRPASVRYHLDDLIGEAPAMQEVRRLARACARTDLPVLLLGESGTGKEVLAQSIHDESPRRHAPFVAVNCAALPRELMESELFGHAAGAFTGARRDGTLGKFQAADGGTLFLDEVAELSPAAQASLLRVLQEGEVTRLGEHVSRPLDVRIIAATNRDVRLAVADGRLRDDLYHRLDVLGITLPPLRARLDDLPRLVDRFLRTAPGSHGHTVTEAVMRAFTAYAWPGNVRELRNVIHRMIALAESTELGVSDLPPALRMSGGPSPVDADTTSSGAPPHEEEVSDAARDLARAQLAAVIERHATMADAAAALGITRSTLYRRLERHGLVPGRSVRHRPQ
ncbi:MAG TPA: sigma 54-interacting transcriptional regulator [Gemmatimonadaceae bacterium]|nr:sigma 54-interacting transcriptional regulator [Gemmatimonadaceae bacterium]